MNDRIRKLYLQAHSIRHYDGDPALDGNPPTVYWQGEVSAHRFAQLIVKECCDVLQNEDIRHSGYGYNQGFLHKKIKQHFGVEESQGWVCPKCGTDRTKYACPRGNGAAVDGSCPMFGVANEV